MARPEAVPSHGLSDGHRSGGPAGSRRLTNARRALRLAGGLGGLVGVGTMLLWLPVSGGPHALRLDEAFFTAVSALATTGLTVITPATDLSVFGQIILLVLMQAGGIGFMAGAVVIYRLLGRRVTLEERYTLRDALGLVSGRAIVQLTLRVVRGVFVIEGLGALVLWLNWQADYGPGQAAFLAIFHSISAFCNASFDLFGGSSLAVSGFPTDSATLLILSTLVILGSIGVPVLADLGSWPRRRALSLHTRVTLITAGGLLAFGALASFVGQSRSGVLFSDLPWPQRLLFAYFHSATSRTSGFVVQPLTTMAPDSVLILMALMFIGGSPASMGGGITTSTLAILVLAMWNYVQGRTAVTAGRRTIPAESITKAAAVLIVSIFVVGGVTWLLLLTQQATLVEALFETVSAFATCGFTLGLTPRLDLFGRVLIAFTMFWGRLGPLSLIMALAQRRPPPRVIYPEEHILLG